MTVQKGHCRQDKKGEGNLCQKTEMFWGKQGHFQVWKVHNLVEKTISEINLRKIPEKPRKFSLKFLKKNST